MSECSTCEAQGGTERAHCRGGGWGARRLLLGVVKTVRENLFASKSEDSHVHWPLDRTGASTSA